MCPFTLHLVSSLKRLNGTAAHSFPTLSAGWSANCNKNRKESALLRGLFSPQGGLTALWLYVLTDCRLAASLNYFG